MIKVVILKGQAARHNYFAEQIRLIEGVDTTIISFERLGKERLLKMLWKDFSTFFSRITKYLIQTIRAYDKRELAAFGNIKLNEHIFQNINSADCVSFIKSQQPDIILIFGTPIISRKIIELPKFGAINLHGGISPWYKGGNTIFWALFNNDLDKVGATIHYALPKVDSGKMLVRIYCDIRPGDTELSTSIRTFMYAIDEICRMLNYLKTNQQELKGKEQEVKGTLYLAKKRTIWVDLTGHKRIQANTQNQDRKLRIERYYE